MPDDISKPSPLALQGSPLPGSPLHGSALEVARERTIRILTDRFADDTLSVDEFEARLDRMYQARSPAELDALLAEVEQRAARQGAAAVAPPYAGAAPRRMLAIMSDTKRTGRWAMPRELEVRAVMSSLTIDLRDVVMPAGVCEIDLLAVMADVQILVPPHLVVEEMALSVMANVENAAMDDGLMPVNAPRLRVTGTAIMSNLEILVGELRLPLKEAMKQARKARRKGIRPRP